MTLVRDQGGSVAAAISVLAIYIMLFEKYLKQSADGLGALGKKNRMCVLRDVRVVGVSVSEIDVSVRSNNIDGGRVGSC